MLKLLTLFCVVYAAYGLVLPASMLASYTDAFARNQMLALASAAYSSNPQHCLDTKFTNAQLKRQIYLKNCALLNNDVCSGYTAVLHNDKAIVISFRGTQGFFQLISEANKSIFESQMSWVAGGKVSKYFGDAFSKVWAAGMKDDFASLLSQNPGYEIWVSGHSLGGSLASLAASYIIGTKLVDGSRVKLVTYGEPRTGNKDYAHAHDNQLAFSYRVTHNRDVVPHVPNEDFEGYYHNKYEVYYRENMKAGAKFTICNGDEDNSCSDGLWITTSIDDHLHYFEKDISAWGDKGCN
uniref:Lipase_3 domain-containing protein n=1 Tax=Caenorhabditis tropicalis TaxID=1561998 RepID=A0A1I7U763_9PELO